MKLATTLEHAPRTDASDSDGGSSEEDEEDGDVITMLMDTFCEVFAYARTIHEVFNWFNVLCSRPVQTNFVFELNKYNLH
jgi:hypothetical protein